MKISVIVPSRLHANPNSEHGNLWLDLSLMSVRRQTCWNAHAWQMLVGLSPCTSYPGLNYPHLPERFADVYVSPAPKEGQAAAVNDAVKHSAGDIIAILEDDDTWEPSKLAHQLPLLDNYDFVSCNQREMADDRATWLRVNDFPTPSGWVMRRELWDELGGFDETYRYHMDTHFLGKLNVAKKKRVHVVERDVNWERPWLRYVARNSSIAQSDSEREQLVVRIVNSKGGMARIASDPAAKAISDEEHRRMFDQFGEVPW